MKTVDDRARAAGFSSAALAKRWGVTTQTVRDWAAKHPERFADMLAGAQLRNLAISDKNSHLVTNLDSDHARVQIAEGKYIFVSNQRLTT